MGKLYLAVLVFFISCRPTVKEVETVTIPAYDTRDTGNEKQNNLEIISKKLSNEETIRSLKKNFKIQEDKFNSTSFYTHKNWPSNWPSRSCLYCYFNTRGQIFLVSMYHADDWIFHTSATVLITGQTMKTSEVETYSEWNKTDNNSNGVYENVSHIDEIDKKVIEWVAANTDKKISVQLEGRQYRKDFTMTGSDKKAFKDTWKLYSAMF